jgi:2-keto-4-pentenoate hydratase
MTTINDPRLLDQAADRLVRAQRSRTPCEPVRDLLGEDDLGAAYRVQDLIGQDRISVGARVVGRKIGLTNPAVRAQLGVDQPDSGVLFDDMRIAEDEPVPVDKLLQPKIEAEVAFVLRVDLDHEAPGLLAVRSAIDYAVAALEIVDSRIRDWDIRITDTVADNASSGLFVLGTRRIAMSRFEPADVAMSMTVNDSQRSAGSGADCMGDPLVAVQWLARTCALRGSPLRAGEIVLSGALGPMVAVGPGALVRAELSELGPVSASFACARSIR